MHPEHGPRNSGAVVVDVMPLLRVGIREVLGLRGIHTIAETALGSDVADLVRAHDPALVVLGAVGDLSPAEVVRRIQDAASGTTILLLLSSAQRPVLPELLALGLGGIVPRAAPPDALNSALDRVLLGERFVDPAVLGDADALQDDPIGATALTEREREVLALLKEGQSNRSIASSLYVSLPTVKTHLAHIYAKLGARNRNEALGRAVALGLLR